RHRERLPIEEYAAATARDRCLRGAVGSEQRQREGVRPAAEARDRRARDPASDNLTRRPAEREARILPRRRDRDGVGSTVGSWDDEIEDRVHTHHGVTGMPLHGIEQKRIGPGHRERLPIEEYAAAT